MKANLSAFPNSFPTSARNLPMLGRHSVEGTPKSLTSFHWSSMIGQGHWQALPDKARPIVLNRVKQALSTRKFKRVADPAYSLTECYIQQKTVCVNIAGGCHSPVDKDMRCSMWLVIEPYLTACRVCTAEPLCCGQGCCSRIQNQEQEFSHSLLRSTSIQQDVTVFTELHSTARESCQIVVKH